MGVERVEGGMVTVVVCQVDSVPHLTYDRQIILPSPPMTALLSSSHLCVSPLPRSHLH